MQTDDAADIGTYVHTRAEGRQSASTLRCAGRGKKRNAEATEEQVVGHEGEQRRAEQSRRRARRNKERGEVTGAGVG